MIYLFINNNFKYNENNKEYTSVSVRHFPGKTKLN